MECIRGGDQRALSPRTSCRQTPLAALRAHAELVRGGMGFGIAAAAASIWSPRRAVAELLPEKLARPRSAV
jgi:hypothetical protein